MNLLYLILIVYGILGLYFIVTKDISFGTIGRILALGYPLIWNIKNTWARRLTATLIGIALILSKSWICIVCGFLTWLIIYHKNIMIYCKAHKVIVLLLTSVFFSLSSFYLSVNRKPLLNLQEEALFRIEFIKLGLDNWQNKILGDGANSFYSLRKFWRESVPEKIELQSSIYRAEKKGDKKYYIYDIHCDFLQWSIEFGVILGSFLIFLLILPLAFLSINNLYEKTILSAYLCLVFQCLVDFPLHRSTTSLLSMIIITLGYKQVWEKIKTK